MYAQLCFKYCCAKQHHNYLYKGFDKTAYFSNMVYIQK